MPSGSQFSACPRCASVSSLPSVTSSTSWSVEGIIKEKGTDESLSSPKVWSLGSYPVRGEGVQGALTLFCGGAAQTFHDDRAVELKEQLVVEEEDGDRQEEKVE